MYFCRRKIMKKLLTLLLAALMIVTMVACSDKDKKDDKDSDNSKYQNKTIEDSEDTYGSDTFYFENVDSETVIITKFVTTDDTAHTVTIPAYFEKEIGEGEEPQYLRVVGIGKKAFSNSSSISALVFPTEANYLERDAAFDMSTHYFMIGDYAFSDCVALKEINLPAYVTEIGVGAFVKCSTLQTITFEEGSRLAEVKANAFCDCIALTAIDFPASVQSIGNNAFFECVALESVIINEGTTLIGDNAFQNCVALATLKLPTTLASIGKYAFHGSQALYEDGLEYAGNTEAIVTYIKSLALTERPEDPELPDAPADPADPAV